MWTGFSRLGLRTHQNKTWVGKAEQGFDFLGYHLKREEVTVAKATVARCVIRIRRLHEQERRNKFLKTMRRTSESEGLRPFQICRFGSRVGLSTFPQSPRQSSHSQPFTFEILQADSDGIRFP